MFEIRCSFEEEKGSSQDEVRPSDVTSCTEPGEVKTKDVKNRGGGHGIYESNPKI